MTELSTAERARLDEFEARPAAEESLRERVAQALHLANCGEGCTAPPSDRNRRDAVAAIDAMRPAPDAPQGGQP